MHENTLVAAVSKQVIQFEFASSCLTEHRYKLIANARLMLCPTSLPANKVSKSKWRKM
jgi:hypothetical protein